MTPRISRRRRSHAGLAISAVIISSTLGLTLPSQAATPQTLDSSATALRREEQHPVDVRDSVRLAAVAVERALALLAQLGIMDVPPVQLVDRVPGDVPATAFRLVRPDGSIDTPIYVLRSTTVFQRALAGDPVAIIQLASTLAHERAHGFGADEPVARKAQVDVIDRLLAKTGGPLSGRQVGELLALRAFACSANRCRDAKAVSSAAPFQEIHPDNKK